MFISIKCPIFNALFAAKKFLRCEEHKKNILHSELSLHFDTRVFNSLGRYLKQLLCKTTMKSEYLRYQIRKKKEILFEHFCIVRQLEYKEKWCLKCIQNYRRCCSHTYKMK